MMKLIKNIRLKLQKSSLAVLSLSVIVYSFLFIVTWLWRGNLSTLNTKCNDQNPCLRFCCDKNDFIDGENDFCVKGANVKAFDVDSSWSNEAFRIIRGRFYETPETGHVDSQDQFDTSEILKVCYTKFS